MAGDHLPDLHVVTRGMGPAGISPNRVVGLARCGLSPGSPSCPLCPCGGEWSPKPTTVSSSKYEAVVGGFVHHLDGYTAGMSRAGIIVITVLVVVAVLVIFGAINVSVH